MVPERIVLQAKKKGLKGIAVTDHNTINGGLQAKSHNRNSDILVIVGSEVRTDQCEIIGLFLNEEIYSKDPFAVLDEIKDQGGISVLPHPFRSLLIPRHKGHNELPLELVKRVDLIEAVNARTKAEDNCKALNLAKKVGKPTVSGSDAHTYPEIARVKTLLPPVSSEEELRKNLREGRTSIAQEQSIFPKGVPYLLLSGLYGRARKITRLI